MLKQRLGEFLVSKKLITRFQLEAALKEQSNFGRKLGDILIDNGYISEGDLIEAISEFKNIKFVDLATVTPSKTALSTLPGKFCKENLVYPLRLRDENGRKVLYVVLSDSFNLDLLDQIKFRTDVSRVEPVICSQRAIEAAIDRDYFNINLMVPKLDYTKRDVTSIDDLEEEGDIVIEEKIENEPSPIAKNSSADLIALEAEIAVLNEKIKDLNDDLTGLDKRNKALLKILINKGFITREEYFHELKK